MVMYDMISPHTALMYKAISSKVNTDIINALIKCETLKIMDFESMLELNRGILYYYINELISLGMIEQAKSIYDDEINTGWKLTKKGYKTIDDLNQIILEVNKFA